MTKTQIKEAKRLIGKMPRDEIAEKLGVSLSSLKRAFRGTRLAFHNWCVRQPDLIRRVSNYYEKHGRKKTAVHFNLTEKQVDYIAYRFKLHKPRQIQWTNDQLIELARMAGIISIKAQAKYFNRPRAHEGSIKSVWMKRFGIGGGTINGMSDFQAKYIVTDKCPRIRTKFWSQRKISGEYGRKLCLWVDMEKHIRPGMPDLIVDTIKTMAEFQRWLFESKDPRKKILKMIKEREVKV